ncbi:hypothetical protein C8R46DRAFT_824002, partial [Mycena filopes]
RCLDCYGADFLCDVCIVSAHQQNPLHQIMRWHDGVFSKVNLKTLGLRIFLGHGPGLRCPDPQRESHFIIVDCDQSHDVAIEFCGCKAPSPTNTRARQLLARRLYPTSYERPRAAVSFRMI